MSVARKPAASAAGPPDPIVDVGLAAVVGGQGERRVVAVAIEQVAQVVGAVGDVRLRIGEVGDRERRAARRRAMKSAVSGWICISPFAPVDESRASNFDSA